MNSPPDFIMQDTEKKPAFYMIFREKTSCREILTDAFRWKPVWFSLYERVQTEERVQTDKLT